MRKYVVLFRLQRPIIVIKSQRTEGKQRNPYFIYVLTVKWEKQKRLLELFSFRNLLGAIQPLA